MKRVSKPSKIIIFSKNIIPLIQAWVGDDAFSIATRSALDDPGIELRLGRGNTYPSRTALGTTQPPVQLVKFLFTAGKEAAVWR